MCAAAVCGKRYREEAGGKEDKGRERMQRWIKREDAKVGKH